MAENEADFMRLFEPGPEDLGEEKVLSPGDDPEEQASANHGDFHARPHLRDDKRAGSDDG